MSLRSVGPHQNDLGTKLGFAAVLACYGLWGTSALFMHGLNGVPPLQITAHRVLWSFISLLPFALAHKRRSQLKGIFRSPKSLGLLVLTTFLIASNWLLFVYAISENHAIQASLGYYIVPLFLVACASIVLKERFSLRQTFALTLVVAAIAILVIGQKQLPWISLALALSFGLYGLLRKMIRIDAVTGLFLETALLTPFALAILLWAEYQGTGAVGLMVFEQGRLDIAALLLLGCPLWTALPLFFFGYATRRLRLSVIGLIQYVNPTLQFLIAVLIFKEDFSRLQAATFALIWVGIALYSWPSPRKFPAPQDA